MTALAALGSAAIGAAGNIYAGSLSSSSARAINQSNIAYQREANRLQIDLANTAHQREVADLRAAGLNPILAASGSGSTVPTLGTPSLVNPAEGMASGIKSASDVLSRSPLGLAQLQQSLAQTEQTRLGSQQTAIVNSALRAEKEASVAESHARVAQADYDRLFAEANADALHSILRDTVDIVPVDPARSKAVVKPSPYRKLIEEGIKADLKNRSNLNWRANLGAFLGGANSASSAAAGAGNAASIWRFLFKH